MRLKKCFFLFLFFLGVLFLAPKAQAAKSCPHGYTACCGNCFEQWDKEYCHSPYGMQNVYCGPGHMTNGGCTPEYNCNGQHSPGGNWCYDFTWCEGQSCCKEEDGGGGGGGDTGCPTSSPYNGQSCTVHPPGGQCPSDYQWCDGGCCRWTGGGGGGGGGGGWSCPSYPGCQPGQCGTITQYLTCKKCWTPDCPTFSGDKCTQQSCNWDVGNCASCPSCFKWCYAGKCRRTCGCPGDVCDYKTKSRKIDCGPCCSSHASYSCWNDDVWWYDSCGKKEGQKDECGSDGWAEPAEYRCVDLIEQRKYYYRGCSGNNCYQYEDWIDVGTCAPPLSTVSGVVFIDENRNGAKEVDEACFDGQVQIWIDGEEKPIFQSTAACNPYSYEVEAGTTHQIYVYPIPPGYTATGWSGTDDEGEPISGGGCRATVKCK